MVGIIIFSLTFWYFLQFRTLTYPFDAWTWIFLGGSILAVAAALYLLKLPQVRRAFVDPAGCRMGSYEIFSISVITLISESLPHEMFDLRRHSGFAAVAFFVWFPTGLLLSFAYKSILLACLVAVQQTAPVATFQEVLDQQVTFVLPEGYLMTALMRDSKREVVRWAKWVETMYTQPVLVLLGTHSRWRH